SGTPSCADTATLPSAAATRMRAWDWASVVPVPGMARAAMRSCRSFIAVGLVTVGAHIVARTRRDCADPGQPRVAGTAACRSWPLKGHREPRISYKCLTRRGPGAGRAEPLWRRRMRKILIALLLALPMAAFAQQSPVGTWTTIDDDTGQPKSVVEITEADDGSLVGTVREVLQSDQGPNPVCSKCSGDRKDQPSEGMQIIWGVNQKGDSWTGGQILDPASGKTYSGNMQTADGGEKLEVRGFMGFSLLGRTQVWERR